MTVLAATAVVGQAPPAPILGYGGRTFQGGRILVLDSGPESPRLLTIDPATLHVSERRLEPGSREITTYGLVAEASDRILVLAEKGRRLLGFPSGSAAPDRDESLDYPSSGLWALGGKILVNPIQLGRGEPLLMEWTGRELTRFGSLTPRDGTSRETRLVGNILRCAPEFGGELPCWHMARGNEVFFLRADGRLRRVSVKAMAVEATPPRNPGDPAQVVLSWTYPIRDVQAVDGGRFWILTNQEGVTPPTEPGAIRGRHALLIRNQDGSATRTVELPREAKAILAATTSELVLLFTDGTIERVPAR